MEQPGAKNAAGEMDRRRLSIGETDSPVQINPRSTEAAWSSCYSLTESTGACMVLVLLEANSCRLLGFSEAGRYTAISTPGAANTALLS